MTEQQGDAADALKAPSDAMMQWWSQQWLQGVTPMARMQLAWMESLAEAMQFEAQCLHALAESGQRLSGCINSETPANPQDIQECYQQLMHHVTQTHMQRLEKVAELSEDFRNRIWEEL
ncbi:hypothetical protein [Halomonas maura]|uniref:hypothetical protein n=1 Tax=Halomonas maura TaxID=117606 RepID=UPI0025B512BC|nr:hypothetical protein [Halomonas maura]MDN3555205.1 hypothetical protein [Halomonas maura]